MRRTTIFLTSALLSLLVAGSAAAPGFSAPHAPAAKLEPARGAYLGLYYGSGSVASTTRRIGTPPRIHLTYFGWKDAWATAPSTRADLNAGRIPLVNWEPFGADFHDIVSGKYDELIARRAEEAKAVGQPFFLDFAAEMNEGEGWGGHDPALYIAAWRHIHDVFVEHGADNVVWVWAPNNTDSPGAPAALEYYPGDQYVDWTGIDGYNWGTSKPGFKWQNFGQVFGRLYQRLAPLGKPIIIGETASDEVGGSKARWIEALPDTLRHRYPQIKALVWFDIDKERQWEIASSRSAKRAFQRIAANPYFRRAR